MRPSRQTRSAAAATWAWFGTSRGSRARRAGQVRIPLGTRSEGGARPRSVSDRPGQPLPPLPRLQLTRHRGEHDGSDGAVRLVGEAAQAVEKGIGHVLHLQMQMRHVVTLACDI